jgi:small subunit ribosomal protein S3
MAHKVHPKAFRIRRINDWDTRGFYHDPAELLREDFEVREFLNGKIGTMAVEKIEIERSANKISVIVSSARPGLIIGRGGEGVEALKKEIEKLLQKLSPARSDKKESKEDKKEDKKDKRDKVFLVKAGKSKEKREIRIEIREVKNPWTSASLSAQWVAQQLEKRTPFRKVLKQTISKVMANKDIKGVKVEVSGRLNGAEIARREWLKDGQLPLQLIRADIDYAKAVAHCTYGAIGVKVWIYKGEKFE